jgi:hypothetical protein
MASSLPPFGKGGLWGFFDARQPSSVDLAGQISHHLSLPKRGGSDILDSHEQVSPRSVKQNPYTFISARKMRNCENQRCHSFGSPL